MAQVTDERLAETDYGLLDWLDEDSAMTQTKARLHDFPTMQAFFDKYALGPKSKPSCLVCGRADYDKPAIQHLELPGIVVCEACKTARAKLAGVEAGTHCIVPREPTVAMLTAGALKAVEQPSVADVRLAREASREVLKGDVMDDRTRAASADEITGILATMPQYYRAMLSASDGKEG